MKTLFANRALAIAWGMTALAGVLLTRLPLFELPGYELAMAMTLMLALLGGAAGLCAARIESARAAAQEQPERIGPPLLRAVAFSLSALLLPFAAAALTALAAGRCSPWKGAPFFLVLPAVTAFTASAWGLLFGALFERRRAAIGALSLLYLLSLASSLWPLYDGPQLFALDHLFGYFPGPLYDEAIAIDRRLLTFRLLSLAFGALPLALLAVRRADSPRPGPIAALLLCCALLAIGALFEFELWLGIDRADLARALGGERQTPHLAIHFPSEKSAEEVERLARDLEFDYRQVSSFLGLSESTQDEGRLPLRVYLHRSVEEKRRLIGAAETSFARPWRGELHLDDWPSGEPHPVARHELAHLLGAPFGAPPFRVTARAAGLAINNGIVEGLAVAADRGPSARGGELSLHEWAAAMRALKLAPELERLMGTAGFYRAPSSRAYTFVGSFLLYLAQRHGPEPLRTLYAHGDFEAAYGVALTQLSREWERFLDTLPLDDQALSTARRRFERGSIFERPCPREVALLLEEAQRSRSSNPARSLALYERCAALDPAHPVPLRAAARLRAQRGEYGEAELLWRRLLDAPTSSASTQAQALMELGDLAWRRGETAGAKELYAQALGPGFGGEASFERTVRVKLAAADAPAQGELIRRYFDAPNDLGNTLALARLADDPAAGDLSPIANYLVGRQLLHRGAPRAALPYLQRARACGSLALLREVERMMVRAAYLAGELTPLFDATSRMRAPPALAADSEEAEDWEERARFELERYGALVVGER